MTTAAGTSSAGSSPRRGAVRSPNARQALSWRALADTAARDIQEHLLERRPVVAGHDSVRAVVVLDAAAFHDDNAVAQPLHLQHVVRGQQDGGAAGPAIAHQVL